jgi:hypothetical protein
MDQLWVELSGEIIIARVRGEPTVELLAECQAQVVQLAQEAGPHPRAVRRARDAPAACRRALVAARTR